MGGLGRSMSDESTAMELANVVKSKDPLASHHFATSQIIPSPQKDAPAKFGAKALPSIMSSNILAKELDII